MALRQARSPSLTVLTLAAALSLAAPAAAAPVAAGPGQALKAAAFARAAQSRPAIDLRQAGESRPVFPRTAVSHRFSDSGAVASVGYLCGIKPFAPDSYEASRGPVSGFENGLTFLGANLVLPFR